jgi:hypothetical protein
MKFAVLAGGGGEVTPELEVQVVSYLVGKNPRISIPGKVIHMVG